MLNVTSKDGTIIAYNKVGSGSPVILVDGAFCSSSFGPMPKLTSLLSKHFTVINYDRRGRGESGDNPAYAVEREIDDIKALLGVIGGSAALFGMSSGAALAIKAVIKGLNISKLALYEPPFVSIENSNHQPPIDNQAQLKAFIASNQRNAAVIYYFKRVIGIPSFVVAIMRLLPMWSKLKAVANSLPYDSAIMGSFDLSHERLDSILIPTLVLGGTKSPKALQFAVFAVGESISQSKVSMLKGQNHNVSVKVLAPFLVNFFKE